MQTIKKVIFIAVLQCLLFSAYSYSQRLDNILISQNVFSDARYSALAQAGSAMPGSILSTFINPAFLNIYQQSEPPKSAMFGVGYGKDSLFDLGIISTGASFYSGKIGSIGALFRSMTSAEGRSIIETGTIYSGRMFPSSMNHGAVDWGATIRYSRVNWKTEVFDTLHPWVHKYIPDIDFDTLIPDKILDSISYTYSGTGEIHQNNLLLDVGFFQKAISDHMDFGLVFSNLLGYRWTEESPSKETTHVIDSNTTTTPTVYSDTSRPQWTPAITSSEDWTGLSHMVITCGITFTDWPIGDHVAITIPMDVGLYGVLDRSANRHYTFRVGAEAKIFDQYFLRFGFARTPTIIPENLSGVKNQNVFQGGAGVCFAPISFNAYFGNISKNYWGLSATIDIPQSGSTKKRRAGLTGS